MKIQKKHVLWRFTIGFSGGFSCNTHYFVSYILLYALTTRTRSKQTHSLISPLPCRTDNSNSVLWRHASVRRWYCDVVSSIVFARSNLYQVDINWWILSINIDFSSSGIHNVAYKKLPRSIEWYIHLVYLIWNLEFFCMIFATFAGEIRWRSTQPLANLAGMQAGLSSWYHFMVVSRLSSHTFLGIHDNIIIDKLSASLALYREIYFVLMRSLPNIIAGWQNKIKTFAAATFPASQKSVSSDKVYLINW